MATGQSGDGLVECEEPEGDEQASEHLLADAAADPLAGAHRHPGHQGMAGEGAGQQALTLNSISRAPQTEVNSCSGSSPWKQR